MKLLVAAAGIAALALPHALAQTACRGTTLTGAVRDSTLALIPGATLTMDGSQEKTSGLDGQFRYLCVVGGHHHLSVSATGFARREVSFTAPHRNPLDVVLQPEVVHTEVEVNSDIEGSSADSSGPSPTIAGSRLQALADELGLTLNVCHFPPGTSKWNKIEHRLFSFITQNWRGKPLVSHQAIVSLIANATTSTGLIVKAALDTNHYNTAIKVSDEELAGLRLQRHEFHGDWNYTITPRRNRKL